MKKMVKRKNKTSKRKRLSQVRSTSSNRRSKEMKAPFWIVDGFVGVLALMIYNFLLYVLSSIGIGGIIREMQRSTGYFGLHTFMDLGFDLNDMTIGIIAVFLFCFLIGMIVGHVVRTNRMKQGKSVW